MTSRLAVAQRANVPPFHVMDLLAAAAERQRTHGDLVNLVAGQPSTGAPQPVRDEAIRLLAGSDPLGYTVRPACRSCARRSPSTTGGSTGSRSPRTTSIVTTGSSGGFLLAFLAAFEVGDRVAMARPGYPCYRNVLTALGCEVVEIPTGPENRFQPTVEQLEACGDIKGLVIASPANPTGTMLLPGRARGDRGLVRGAGRAAGLRRDLPRHRVRLARPCRAAPGRRRARRSSSARSRSTSP